MDWEKVGSKFAGIKKKMYLCTRKSAIYLSNERLRTEDKKVRRYISNHNINNGFAGDLILLPKSIKNTYKILIISIGSIP